ncbi:methyl-accepting chemotaxis protein [Actinokineospora enzanensis]|uniref:methyl-accepting chemotaxis protein n=1 Tax=Actinokineospora enzanensis TaxID=155975 RepID=UPI000373BC01|nr:methyl-accepting chemotaxis protein [Actinokineospora enzanensis]
MSDSTTPDARRGGLGRFLADRSLATKIFAAIALPAVVAIGVGVQGMIMTHDGAQTSARIGRNAAAVGEISNFNSQAITATSFLLSSFITSDASRVQTEVQGTTSAIADLRKSLVGFQGTLAADPTASQNAKDVLAGILGNLDKLSSVLDDQVFPLATAGQSEQALVLFNGAGQAVMNDMGNGLAQLQQIELTDVAGGVADAASASDTARWTMLTSLGAGLLLALLLGWVTIRGITRSIGAVSSVLESVADGNLTRQVDVRSADEVGRMATSLNKATASMHDTVTAMARGIDSLEGATHEMTGIAGKVGRATDETSSQAGVVAAAAEQVARNVQTVATGADEMSASIKEIAQSANEAADVAGQAVSVAATTNGTVAKLGESSMEIGNVVKVITSIAEQTNLLALNATIEAARAGDAGKGFAVVANEVKDLAQETAKATEDISRRVEMIQADTTNAVHAIDEISEIIGRINDFQLTIASAVEEQTATTAEMNRNVGEAAAGVSEIAASIAGVADGATSATSAIGESDQAMGALTHLSAELQEQVNRFTT